MSALTQTVSVDLLLILQSSDHSTDTQNAQIQRHSKHIHDLLDPLSISVFFKILFQGREAWFWAHLFNILTRNAKVSNLRQSQSSRLH